MRTSLAALAIIGLVFLFTALAIVRTASVRPELPSELVLDVLRQEVSIEWGAQATQITAVDHVDAFAALGYVHGIERPWPMLLWRAVALGQLGERFGEAFQSVDATARMLGVASLAEQAFNDMAPSQQQVLNAYASGMNAALQTPLFNQEQEMLRWLAWTPRVWEPWHTLAVERLFAWLATTPTITLVDSLSQPPVWQFAKGDAALRHVLQLHGFEHGYVAQFSHEGNTHIVSQHVWGASVFPTVMDVKLSIDDALPIQATSLPGTIMLLQGVSTDQTWSYLLQGNAQLVKQSIADPLVSYYDRLVFSDADEQALLFSRTTNALVFSETTRANSDSVWQIVWPGFGQETDFAAWYELWHGERPTFMLFDSLGIYSEGGFDGAVTDANAIELITPSPWRDALATSLESVVRTPASMVLAQTMATTESVWARNVLPTLLMMLDSTGTTSSLAQEAETFLRNWDYQYTPTSIGATLFDAWFRRLSEPGNWTIDAFPMQDTAAWYAFAEPALQQTVEHLEEQFGADMRSWQWGTVYPDRRFFPLHSEISKAGNVSKHFLSYAKPYERPAMGHPTTLLGGGSTLQAFAMAPSRRLTSFQLSQPMSFQVVITDPQAEGVFRRQLEHTLVLDPITVAPVGADAFQTILRPAR